LEQKSQPHAHQKHTAEPEHVSRTTEPTKSNVISRAPMICHMRQPFVLLNTSSAAVSYAN